MKLSIMNASVESLPELLNASDVMFMARVHAAAFLRPWSEKSFEDMMTQKHTFAIGGFEQNELAAFILGSLVKDEAEILTLAVDPKFQRRGFGLKLIETFEEYVSRQGAHKIFLDVAIDNEAALQLYRRLHYKRMGQRQNYYLSETGTQTALTMVKRIY